MSRKRRRVEEDSISGQRWGRISGISTRHCFAFIYWTMLRCFMLSLRARWCFDFFVWWFSAVPPCLVVHYRTIEVVRSGSSRYAAVVLARLVRRTYYEWKNMYTRTVKLRDAVTVTRKVLRTSTWTSYVLLWLFTIFSWFAGDSKPEL